MGLALAVRVLLTAAATWGEARRAPSTLRANSAKASRRPPSLPCLVEVTQIRRRLVLAGRHQNAVAAEEIDLLVDRDQAAALRAIGLVPFGMLVIGVAQIFLVHGPRPRQRMVDHGDLVMQDVAVGLVDIDPLLEHG